jgi:hypothetical protein
VICRGFYLSTLRQLTKRMADRGKGDRDAFFASQCFADAAARVKPGTPLSTSAISRALLPRFGGEVCGFDRAFGAVVDCGFVGFGIEAVLDSDFDGLVLDGPD